MEEILNKYNFKKTEANYWVFYEDYLLEEINPELGYYLKATLHIPKNIKVKRIEDRFSKLILHRYYQSSVYLDRSLSEGDSKVVYEGMIENEEDLKFILTKTGVISAKKK